MNIVSVFLVKDPRKSGSSRVRVTGAGQEVVNYVRKQSPKYSRIVLLGHEVNEDFKPLKAW